MSESIQNNSQENIGKTPHKKENNFRLGDLLVQQALITPLQLQDAMEYQHAHQEMHLGEILIRDNLISKKQLKKCLKRQNALRTAVCSVAMCLLPTQFVFAKDFHSDTDIHSNWQHEIHQDKFAGFNGKANLEFQEKDDSVYSFSGPVTLFSGKMAHRDSMLQKHQLKPEPTQYQFNVMADGVKLKVSYEF